jgi:Protein of unknown function (DUF3800)
MSETFNMYCDENCYLENDHLGVMVLGAVWCPQEKVHEINLRLREIKLQSGLAGDFEIKWTKVSPAGAQLYQRALDYFFDDDDLHFRALIVPDKSKLRHNEFGQSHDEWYYKMYFDMLKVLLSPTARYCIYVDIKDTRGGAKVARLRDVLSNNMYDFSRQIIGRIQIVRSDEVAIMQLTDLLVGTVSYANRELHTSVAKQALVERMRQRSGYTLMKTTLYREDKVNLFRWRAAEKNE